MIVISQSAIVHKYSVYRMPKHVRDTLSSDICQWDETPATLNVPLFIRTRGVTSAYYKRLTEQVVCTSWRLLAKQY